MSEPFATYDDLEDRWRPLTAEEQAKATVLLGDASGIIRDEAPDVDARIAAGKLDANTPLMIACSMVKRAMAGGGELDGVSTNNIQTGPFGQTLSYSNPMGNLYLTKAEKARLHVAGKAFSIDTAPSFGGGFHADICSLCFGAGYCSCGADIAGFPLYEV